ncbi:hypothetical protein A3C98_03555 [Candidatus Roizmanbacteria bacterium RIFCSPHIGHO2_02_FULL_37_15]|uniref:Uncharacterized protein n=1 Tax=Candidatus Roizmanbacteria bacterium RIFCSPLOWO2_01_FULL_37_16 TaxID=1802058 RepID=A0A1F7IIY0_9BACT|nr:MAG: hypothetical protein A2859_05170 [Candidatus Roizmanbacteria bacterium RIFCSPHIGHO2_01_FULL_37_16b]OGK20449.1 MAG: hypothetical protein A3C98_03555 [Candidatus Roizmanbacteria bacterium RIFCSPHIGHO2_02_FULL_37_15]OGK34050.1 MAG: hypothetical protein A3F57_02505 [Candidatus Roizmanbacteria bacterium RIFCSPHIGHO2_12_FULL_36_11]OGK43300.1 MAG: hypothetical protein A3B40_02300 [Candidatus Roizmanbacteria bacterium RIFCSPLOWO2_01_FULL_37_16]
MAEESVGRPLREMEPGSYLVSGRLSCSANSGVTIGSIGRFRVRCHPDQELQEAVGGLLDMEYWRNVVHAKHYFLCKEPDPERHAVYITIDLLGREIPSGFFSTFQVLTPRRMSF